MTNYYRQHIFTCAVLVPPCSWVLLCAFAVSTAKGNRSTFLARPNLPLASAENDLASVCRLSREATTEF